MVSPFHPLSDGSWLVYLLLWLWVCRGNVGIVSLMRRCGCPGSCVSRPGNWSHRAPIAAERVGLREYQEVMALDELIDAVNAALLAGEWAQVSRLTRDLYALAMQAGETDLAELVQDLHWIANDALVHPVAVGEVLAR